MPRSPSGRPTPRPAIYCDWRLMATCVHMTGGLVGVPVTNPASAIALEGGVPYPPAVPAVAELAGGSGA